MIWIYIIATDVLTDHGDVDGVACLVFSSILTPVKSTVLTVNVNEMTFFRPVYRFFAIQLQTSRHIFSSLMPPQYPACWITTIYRAAKGEIFPHEVLSVVRPDF